MKKLVLLVAMMLCCATAILAQNNRISYQAVVRDAQNRLVANKTVTVTVNIYNGTETTAAYTETQTATTNLNGLVSLQIGPDGDNAAWSNIQWKNASIKTTVTLDGTSLGTLEMPLTAVPYALYADFADSVNPNVIANYLTLHNIPDGAEVNVQSDWKQTDTQADDYIKNKPDLTQYATKDALKDTAGDIRSALVDTAAAIREDFPTVPTDVSAFNNDAGYLQSYTETQVLSISHDTIFLTGGSFVKLPAGFSGNYHDLVDTPKNVSSFVNDAGYIKSYTETDPTVKDSLVIITVNGNINEPAGSFTLNQNANDTIDIVETDPTVPDWAKSPNPPAGSGTLNTNNTNALDVNNSEALSGEVKLHKISKTGSYADLNNKPNIKDTIGTYLTDHNYIDQTTLDSKHYLTRDSAVITNLQSNVTTLQTNVTKLQNSFTKQVLCDSVADCVSTSLSNYYTKGEIDGKFNDTTKYVLKTALRDSITKNVELTIKSDSLFLKRGKRIDTVELPTASAQVNADWTAASGVAQILNKPTNVSAFINDTMYVNNKYCDSLDFCSLMKKVNDLVTTVSDLNGELVDLKNYVYDVLQDTIDSLKGVIKDLTTVVPQLSLQASATQVAISHVNNVDVASVTCSATLTNADGYTIHWKVDGTDSTSSNSTLTVNFTVVGTHKVLCTATKDGFSPLKDSVTITVTKGTPTVSAPTAINPTYNGGSQNLVNEGSTTGGTLQYKLNDGEYSTSIPNATNAGNYTVYYKVVGNDNWNDVDEASVAASIAKAALTSLSVTIDGWTSGQTASSPSVTGNSGNGAVTYSYKVQGAEDNTYTTDVPTAAGDYTVRASVAETDNYLAGTATANFTIAAPASPGDDPAPTTSCRRINLGELTDDFVAQDCDTLTGTLDVEHYPVKISIADGATITLNGVTINGTDYYSYAWAGLTCLGDATIILKDGTTNTVKGFHENYPGVYVPEGYTLTIQGAGSLTASSNGWGAGIGGGSFIPCGNIVINGGSIVVTGGNYAAGIGGGGWGCGDITISGGNITANGGVSAAGIGTGIGDACGKITISGGSITANGGASGAGIGTSAHGTCLNITINNTVTSVTATKGTGAPNSIGAGESGSCGTVKFGDETMYNGSSWTTTPTDGGIYDGLRLAITTTTNTNDTWTLTPYVAPAAPTGAINGLFSVSSTKQVYFSQGNLQYTKSTGVWSFMEHQYSTVETNGSYCTNDYGNRDVVSLFGWATSGYNHGATCYQPYSTNPNNENYYAYGDASYNLYDQTGQADWGYNAISNGGNTVNSGWRTLTTEEWQYLFANHTKGWSTVNGVNGYVIRPDGVSTAIAASYTASDWATEEAAGSVFLPAAGYRNSYVGTDVYDKGSIGRYWSSSIDGSSNAYNLYFSSSLLGPNYSMNRKSGESVRLVKDAN